MRRGGTKCAALSTDEVASFRRDGFHFPIHVLDASQAVAALSEFRRYDGIGQAAGGLLGSYRHYPKPHLVASWADTLAHHPHILDAVESLLGPDLLVWATQVFIRRAGSRAGLAWHQDALRYGLEGFAEHALRVWLALTPATGANGTMRFSRGSHRDGLVAHTVRGDAAEDLLRGEEVVPAIEPGREAVVAIEPGQASMHHMAVVHCSGPNRTDTDRVNVAIDYVTPAVRPIGGTDSALLVRGQDRYRNFEPEKRPASDFDGDALACFYRATRLRLRRLEEVLRRGGAGGRHTVPGRDNEG